jgi:shikimate kinase
MEFGQLTPAELDAHLAAGTLRLSFVGMSNAGKSYRSKVLKRDNDFLWYDVDAQIQEALGFKDMGEISSWLGYPTSDNYGEREQKYLDLEQEFTEHASMETRGKNLVFDTTGSVIHLPEKTLELLKQNCLLVHLAVGDEELAAMTERFFNDPKPVAWSGLFSMKDGEDEEAALRRSYPLLLAERLKRYKRLAHITVPAKELRDKSGQETLEIIKRHL